MKKENWQQEIRYYLLGMNKELDLERFIEKLLEEQEKEKTDKGWKKKINIALSNLKIDPLREKREGVRGHLINLIKEALLK